MTYMPDLAEIVGGGLTRIARIVRTDDGVLVTTHCIIPPMAWSKSGFAVAPRR
jgi:hypothetical protein